MLAHRLFAPLKRALPPAISGPIRKAGTAILTPWYFAQRSGHFRSSMKAMAVDRHGDPLPWYTYPAIDFLMPEDFAGRRVIEFGGGMSTLWWASRAKEVVAFDADPQWHALVSARMPANATLTLLREDLADYRPPEGRFDVGIVDGFARFRAAELCLAVASDEGAVIMDNSEGFRLADRHPVMDLFRGAGWMRVDFYGHAPGVIAPHCTSIFFRAGCFLFRGTEDPVKET